MLSNQKRSLSISQLQSKLNNYENLRMTYQPYLKSLYFPQSGPVQYPDSKQTAGLQNEFRIVMKANTCFQGSAIFRWGTYQGITGWWYLGQITGQTILDDEETYSLIRSVGQVITIKCNTRVNTVLDISGSVSGGQVSQLPLDFGELKFNQYIDSCIPGSTVLNVPITDGVVGLQPHSAELGFRKPIDPMDTTTPGWFRAPVITNLSSQTAIYYSEAFVQNPSGTDPIVATIYGNSVRVNNMQSPGEPVHVQFAYTSAATVGVIWQARVYWKYYDYNSNQFIPYFTVNLGSQPATTVTTMNVGFEFVVPCTWDKIEIVANTFTPVTFSQVSVQQIRLTQFSMSQGGSEQNLTILEMSSLETGTTLQLDGVQNIEYVPGPKIYSLHPRSYKLTPPDSLELVNLSVSLLQHHGFSTVYHFDEYREFMRQFDEQSYTDESVREVAQASGLLAIARVAPKVIRGIRAIAHSMPEIKHAASTVARNYAQASTAPHSVARASHTGRTLYGQIAHDRKLRLAMLRQSEPMNSQQLSTATAVAKVEHVFRHEPVDDVTHSIGLGLRLRNQATITARQSRTQLRQQEPLRQQLIPTEEGPVMHTHTPGENVSDAPSASDSFRRDWGYDVNNAKPSALQAVVKTRYAENDCQSTIEEPTAPEQTRHDRVASVLVQASVVVQPDCTAQEPIQLEAKQSSSAHSARSNDSLRVDEVPQLHQERATPTAEKPPPFKILNSADIAQLSSSDSDYVLPTLTRQQPTEFDAPVMFFPARRLLEPDCNRGDHQASMSTMAKTKQAVDSFPEVEVVPVTMSQFLQAVLKADDAVLDRLLKHAALLPNIQAELTNLKSSDPITIQAHSSEISPDLVDISVVLDKPAKFTTSHDLDSIYAIDEEPAQIETDRRAQMQVHREQTDDSIAFASHTGRTAFAMIKAQRKARQETKPEEIDDYALGKTRFTVERDFPVIGGRSTLIRRVRITTDSRYTQGDADLEFKTKNAHIYYYGFVSAEEGSDMRKQQEEVLEEWGEYLADVTNATKFYVILEGGVQGVSFSMAMVAAVHGFDSDWLYSGCVGPSSMMLAALDIPEQDMLIKRQIARDAERPIMLITGPQVILDLKDDELLDASVLPTKDLIVTCNPFQFIAMKSIPLHQHVTMPAAPQMSEEYSNALLDQLRQENARFGEEILTLQQRIKLLTEARPAQTAIKTTRAEKFENNDLAIFLDIRGAQLTNDDTFFTRWVANKKLPFLPDPSELENLKQRALRSVALQNGRGVDTNEMGRFRQKLKEAAKDPARMAGLQTQVGNLMGAILQYTPVDITNGYMVFLGHQVRLHDFWERHWNSRTRSMLKAVIPGLPENWNYTPKTAAVVAKHLKKIASAMLEVQGQALGKKKGDIGRYALLSHLGISPTQDDDKPSAQKEKSYEPANVQEFDDTFFTFTAPKDKERKPRVAYNEKVGLTPAATAKKAPPPRNVAEEQADDGVGFGDQFDDDIMGQ